MTPKRPVPDPVAVERIRQEIAQAVTTDRSILKDVRAHGDTLSRFRSCERAEEHFGDAVASLLKFMESETLYFLDQDTLANDLRAYVKRLKTNLIGGPPQPKNRPKEWTAAKDRELKAIHVPRPERDKMLREAREVIKATGEARRARLHRKPR